mgnify:CR=1 FL=1
MPPHMQAAWDFLPNEEKPFWVWVAGIIDGESYIGIELKHRRVFEEQLILRVQMLDSRAIQRLREITHVGSVRQQKAGYGNRKPTFVWTAINNQAEAVLKTCLPLLVVKRPHAILVLAYMEVRHLQPWAGGHSPLPFGFRQKRTEIRLKLAELNKRGKRDE